LGAAGLASAAAAGGVAGAFLSSSAMAKVLATASERAASMVVGRISTMLLQPNPPPARGVQGFRVIR